MTWLERKPLNYLIALHMEKLWRTISRKGQVFSINIRGIYKDLYLSLSNKQRSYFNVIKIGINYSSFFEL